MYRKCCLVAIAAEDFPRVNSALKVAIPNIEATVALFDIPVLSALAPALLVLDIDRLEDDPLESLRQLRFVLPDCAIVVYTASALPSLVRSCHNAGANCLLSKSSTEAQLTHGLLYAMRSGCFTDPRFVA